MSSRLCPAAGIFRLSIETNIRFRCSLLVAVGSGQYVNAHRNHNNPPAAWFTPPQQKGEV
jgi:hypothetical protein